MIRTHALLLRSLLPGLLTLMWVGPVAAAPSIRGIDSGAGERITISGSDFGKACGQCEVLADYGGGFKYALPSESWSDKRITARLADLNKSLNIKISVKTPQGTSNTSTVRLSRKLVPGRDYNRPVPPGSKPDFLLFDHQSNLAVGDKGERSLDVGGSAPACGKSGTAFDHAELVYGKRRFGEAQIIAAPPAGCTRCPPLKVRWYHEPTGYLHFQVLVYRRQVEGVCPDRVRR
ncbi:MAG: hypothetical protein H6970_06810 [Gammaproteobacteria bacterium]|nr:hypothetical protein [Gammaproteobacteria bacterium]MCP5459200.1 hypothetical protein [Gammaproteobacteria bacterium]